MIDVISPETSFGLREAVARYVETVRTPLAMEGVARFATAGAVEVVPGDRTLITALAADSVAVTTAYGGTHSKLFNIDIPSEGPAVVVAPGLYNEDGVFDEVNGKRARLVVRPLTDLEGKALITDIHQVIDTLPQDRLNPTA